jgi:hypothetical protein
MARKAEHARCFSLHYGSETSLARIPHATSNVPRLPGSVRVARAAGGGRRSRRLVPIWPFTATLPPGV